jgi:density-regulated protein
MASFEEGAGLKEAGGVGDGEYPFPYGMVDFDSPAEVIYHPTAGIPAEFCEYMGSFLDKEMPWVMENCPEAMSPEALAKAVAKLELGASGEDGAAQAPKDKKERGAGIAAKKEKASVGEARVIVARIQRQKRKFVTAVQGLDTIVEPETIKLKDAAKLFGKKFASGAAVSDAGGGGGKEIVIQGDVQHDIPELLMRTYHVPPEIIFFLEGNKLSRYQG